MTAQDLIESGIVELYCLGIASDDEKKLVEEMAAADHALQEEIAAVNEALARYALAASSQVHKESVKEKIFASIQSHSATGEPEHFPPLLDKSSKAGDWLNYLAEYQILPAEPASGLEMIELPGNDACYTYVVIGEPGAVVDEEVHEGHEEFLLICSGTCEMVINGERKAYHAGDLISIVPGIRHSGLVTGSEQMIVIGQRRAA